jgi:hypothetical protein
MSLARIFALSAVTLGLAFVVPACAANTDDDSTASGDTGDEQDIRGVKHCAGFAGLTCSGGLSCVDDPIDSCDPANGGRDCSGLCVDAKKAPKCGGIAGLACPSGLSCVDAPGDSCDPSKGGADCGGICVKAACDPKLALTVTCKSGTSFDTAKCACVAPESHLTCANVRCQSGYSCEMKGLNGGKAVPVCTKNDKSDCRTNGCGTGKWCSACWGSFACIPKGAMC